MISVQYRIHIPLWRFEGAKSGRRYNCTPGALIEAPEGEFKTLAAGRECSRIDASRDDRPPTTDDEQPDDGEADDS